MTPTDKQLVSCALRGDRDAFAALVRRYRHQVYGLCWDRLRDRDDAEDAAQDTFLAAYQKLSALRRPERFAPWLRAIAANVCRMRGRRLKLEGQHRDRTSREADLESQPAETPPALAVAVNEALSTLPDTQRLPFVLRHIDGLSYDEIADFIGAETSTVRGRIHAAKKRLREEMADMAVTQIRKQRLSRGFTKAVAKSLFWHEQPIQIAEKIGRDEVCFLYLDLRNAPCVRIEGASGKYLRATGRKVLFGESAEDAESRAAQVRVEVARRRDVFATGPIRARSLHGVSFSHKTVMDKGRKLRTEKSSRPIYAATAELWESLKGELSRFPDTRQALRDALSPEVVELTACTDDIASMWLQPPVLRRTQGFAGVGGGDRAGRAFVSAGGAQLAVKLPRCRLLVVVVDCKASVHLSKIRNDVLVVGHGYELVHADGIRGDLHVFNCIPEALSDIEGSLRLNVPFYGGGGSFPKGRGERMGWEKRTVAIGGVRGSVWARVRSLGVDLSCEGAEADVESAFGDLRVALPNASTDSRYQFRSITGSVDVRLKCPWPDGWKAALWTEAGAVQARPVRKTSEASRFGYGNGCPERVYRGTVPWQERENCHLQACSALGDVSFRGAPRNTRKPT